MPSQSHESGSYCERGGVGDAGGRRQEPAAGDRRRRGLEQADQEAQEEGGLRGDRGAQDARHLRRVVLHLAPGGGDQAGRVAVPRRLAAAVLPVPVRGGADEPVRLPPPPVADDGRAGWLRRRLRKQLRARGGAEPPGQLLAAGREARLLPDGKILLPQRRRWRWRRRHHLQVGATPRQRLRFRWLLHTVARAGREGVAALCLYIIDPSPPYS